MKEFHLSNMLTLSEYDGPKLVVDLYTFCVFVWNDYAPRESGGKSLNSYWVGFFLSQDRFFDFLKNKISLYHLFENEKIHYAYLLNDFETLVVDQENFRFVVTDPDEDSFIEDDSKNLLPIKKYYFGNLDNFCICIISYGFRYSLIRIYVNNLALSDLTECDKRDILLDTLLTNFFRLSYDHSCALKYFDKPLENTSRLSNSFDWQILEKKNFLFLKKFLNQKEFFIFKEGNNFVILNNEDVVTIFSSRKNCFLQTIEPYISNYERRINTLKNDLDIDTLISISTGMNHIFYKKTCEVLKEKLENVENFCETPLLCAARFANGLIGDLEAQGILSSIDGIEIKNSDNPNRNNLRNLSLCIPKAVFNPYFASFRQGYILAKYVRKNLNIKDFVVDICSIYAFLGVEIKKIKFPKKLHAVAVWFDLEIAVFVNSDLFDERNKRLFNTTLAHELAHILVDRGNALPIADIVLSDTIKSEIEQRARAFAAEFLLPQSLVGHPENRTAKNVLEIAEKYGVGDILAAYQIRNAHKSEIYVSDTLLEEAQSLIQKYEAGEGLYNFQ